jgi:curved DNA-binding protein
MMEFKDYYKILGVERTATAEDVKHAYRKLARKYHPDVSKEAGSEARFKEIGEAYHVLQDSEKRAAYDQLGDRWRPGQEFTPPPDWSTGFEFTRGTVPPEEAVEFSDFFSALFGDLGRAVRPPRTGGEDYHAKTSSKSRMPLPGQLARSPCALRTWARTVASCCVSGH